jgi:cyclopropane-fatty-acyl-phospholipid synthase
LIAKKLHTLFEQAGVTINGAQPWDVQIHDNRWYRRVCQKKNLGLGESYMDGWWDCGQIDEMISRLLRGGLDDKLKGSFRYSLGFLPEVLFNLQSRARSSMIAEHHYDLDNDLFSSFLDPYHQYSCGFFEATDDLDLAQQKKLDLIAGKLNLSAKDHVLDIGCGWGGLAYYAAKRYGCTVTAANISQEQLRHARAYCKDLPVYFYEGDYRTIEGRFDKIVSVGMFEHVGRKNYRTFMAIAHRLLKEEGIFLLHTIGNNTSMAHCDPWITRYIFPNSMLPSLRQISQAAENYFVIEDVHNLGPHYDKTLMAWNERFQRAWPVLRERYSTRFKRMWEYYLLSCAGAFRARNIQLWQLVMTKHGIGVEQPSCRF